jgi:hypothetical protein
MGGEQLEANIQKWRSYCVRFTSDGTRAIAMDAKGALVVIDFSVERSGIIKLMGH